LGYCNVGVIIQCGSKVKSLNVGDRVVSNGRHAEIVVAPENLCVKVPSQVSDDDASFTVLAAIALQGIRLVNPTLGETIAVLGLGLVGLLTVQLLRAQGCRVIAADFDVHKLKLAEKYGAEIVNLGVEDIFQRAHLFSKGNGVDGVLITASTPSSDPVHHAAQISRKRGRIVLVGVTGLELNRSDFYEKELTFQVSCSYGPGRYDPLYEEGGLDYPIGFVRWTERRNFEAVLDLLADSKIEMNALISHRFKFTDSLSAYELVLSDNNSLGVILDYPNGADEESTRLLQKSIASSGALGTNTDTLSIGFIGSGNYATSVLAPIFKATGANLKGVASRSGISAFHLFRKFGFKLVTTDSKELLDDPNLDAVVISTRHDTHASFVVKALNSGKHIFVEKPLCISLDELEDIERAHSESSKILMVGFNRRFSPHVKKIKELIGLSADPKVFIVTVNAGRISKDHWTQDQNIGGGRIIGETCHFIDLLRHLCGHSIVSHSVKTMNDETQDTVIISLAFADGSIGSIAYLANGNKSIPKERVEIFVAGKILRLDNFRNLEFYGWRRLKSMRLWKQDKGQKNCVQEFVNSINSGLTPISSEEIFEVARISIEIAESMKANA
jgi:predicted dehydrogenase/threonine dehydrogenase-like Zn-dependent dehydrogenase